jgi:hypothetical protein
MAAGIMAHGGDFKGRQFTAEVIVWAMRWYLMFPISYRDLELMLQDRGVEVDHTTLFRWIQAYAPELEKRIRPHLHRSNGSWRVDETSYEDRCVKLVLFSAGRHRPSPCVLASMGAEVELRAARGALANLVSGGTASAPRSLIRVGGAPRRATPLYVIGAARQPTSRHGRRSLGPTRPVPHGGSGPICPFHSPVSRRPVSLPPCRSRHRSVRPASAPSLAAWYRPGGIARARSGAFSPGQRP